MYRKWGDRWSLVGGVVVVLVCVDLRYDMGVAEFASYGGSRTWPLVSLMAVLLVAVAAAGVVRVRLGRAGLSAAVAARLQHAGPSRPLTIAFGALGFGGCWYVALSALVLLPMAEAPGYSLPAIYSAVGRYLGGEQLRVDILAPVVFGAALSVAVLGLTVLFVRVQTPWPWVAVLVLVSMTALAVSNFFLGAVSFGTDVPDVLPPGAGVRPASDLWFTVVSQVALCVAVVIAAAALPTPEGKVQRRRQDRPDEATSHQDSWPGNQQQHGSATPIARRENEVFSPAVGEVG